MSAPLVEDLLKLEDGMYMYDASKEEQVLVFAPVMSILCDNPRASELLNHLGSSAKKFCRVCLVNFSHCSIYSLYNYATFPGTE